MHRFLTHTLLLLSLLAPGCASIDPAQQQERITGKSFAVASTVGNELQLVSVAPLFFGNIYGRQAVPSWSTDEVITAAAKQALASTKAATVSVATLGPGKPAPQQASSVTADYLLVFERATLGDPMTGSNQSTVGLGVIERRSAMHKVFAYAAIAVKLIDVPTGKVVAEAHTLESWALTYGTGKEPWPRKDYGRFGPLPITFTKGAQLSDDELSKIEPDMAAAASRATLVLLKRIGLLPAAQ